MRVRPVYDSKIARFLNVGAITIFPFVLFSMSKAQALTGKVIQHECVHVRQVRALGWWRFYASYVWQWMKGRSPSDEKNAITFEREAYDGAHAVMLSASEVTEFEL